MDAQLASIDQVKNTVLDLAIRFGPKLLVAILILAVGFAASRWMSRWFLRGLSHVELEPPVRTLLARVAWVPTLSVFVILALQILGVEPLPLIAGLGVAGAGIVLATQGVLSNVITTPTSTPPWPPISEVLAANPRVLKDLSRWSANPAGRLGCEHWRASVRARAGKELLPHYWAAVNHSATPP